MIVQIPPQNEMRDRRKIYFRKKKIFFFNEKNQLLYREFLKGTIFRVKERDEIKAFGETLPNGGWQKPTMITKLCRLGDHTMKEQNLFV